VVADPRPAKGTGAVGRAERFELEPHEIQFLHSVGALTELERSALESERYARWGRTGRCASPMLAAGAAGVPEWLECCVRNQSRG
jgi:hypothetical protein